MLLFLLLLLLFELCALWDFWSLVVVVVVVVVVAVVPRLLPLHICSCCFNPLINLFHTTYIPGSEGDDDGQESGVLPLQVRPRIGQLLKGQAGHAPTHERYREK